MSETKSERIPAAQRREQILDAAAKVFGERGYAATTTDQVAQAAGISQPYVVRMFGSKEKLFCELLLRARERLEERMRAALARPEVQALDVTERKKFLGRAYVDLVDEGDIVLPLMQGFLLGHDPVIGKYAREGFLVIYRILRDEAGFAPEDVRDFLAGGMLLNTLLTLQMTQLYDSDDTAHELLGCAFGDKLGPVLAARNAS
ncbi:TetR/AcrR family transcriptional regulator [Gryllotalpicola protaetiae]|uniref:TetR/AcrR family transcriptional regulator n=1 Tax=Gryllotalpicola protaetiae TaxID=2419771 RepID=UPI0013C4534B|nr:TetR/AcrR family transcriptional regulator [Gryllotalpicola protaetiae]